MRVLLRSGLFILYLCFHSGAIAQHTKQAELGVGVICDTAEQMQRYLTLFKDDTSPQVAIQTINSETPGQGACGMALVAFLEGNHIGAIEVSGGIMRIMQITVVAMKTPSGWLSVTPTQQYTAFFEKAEEA